MLIGKHLLLLPKLIRIYRALTVIQTVFTHLMAEKEEAHLKR